MRSSSAWLAAAILLAGTTACERRPPADPVVATVGDAAITLGELQRSFDEVVASGNEYGRDSLSARRFLNDYISKTLIEQMAADSIPWTPLLEHRARAQMELALVNRLREESYASAARLSDEEVQQVYEKARTRYQYRALPFPTEAEALRTLHILREGAVFTKVAEHVTGRQDGADMGWQTTLSAPEEIIDTLAALAPGEVGGPVRVGDGHYLVQLQQREPNPDLPPLAETLHGLRIRLIQERGGRRMADFHGMLLSKYRFEPRMDQILWMADFLRTATAGVRRDLTIADVQTESGEIAPERIPGAPWTENPLPEAERERILATTSADTITTLLLLDHLMTKLSFTWPRFESPDDVARLVREVVISRLEAAEAWERGYDKEPEFVWRARKQRAMMHTRQLYLRLVHSRTRPTESEARRWYEARATSQPERRRYVVAVVRDWDTALRAREVLARGGPPPRAFAEIQQLDAQASWGGDAGLSMTADKITNVLERQVFRLARGGVSDPVPAGNRFAVARVEEISSAQRIPFEEVAEQVIEGLHQIRADSLLNVMVAERRALTPIRIDERVFAQLRWAAETPA